MVTWVVISQSHQLFSHEAAGREFSALKLECSPKNGQVGETFSPDNFILLEDFIPLINALHINEHASVNVTDHLKIECLEPRNVRLPTLSMCPFSSADAKTTRANSDDFAPGKECQKRAFCHNSC